MLLEVPRENGELKRYESYRTALVASGVTAVVALVVAFVDIVVYGSWQLAALDLVHAVLAAVIGVILLRFGRSWLPRRCDLAIVALALPFLVTTWIPQHIVAQHRFVEPFVFQHFLLLGIAFFSPTSLRLTFGLLGAVVLQGIALWLSLRGFPPRSAIVREPLFMLLFVSIAVALVVSRHRQRRLGAQLASTAARAEALAHCTAFVLAFRDQANTPLQTIEVGLTTLERRLPEDGTLLRALRAAHTRLTSIHRAFGTVDIKTRAEDALNPDFKSELSKFHG